MLEEKSLVVIPTYNERGNVFPLFERLQQLGLRLSVLFVDDNSPDGTGREIDELAKTNRNVFTIHRPGKLGLGTAHVAGIEWAYDNGYDLVFTMDCDQTHPPEYLREMLLRLDPSSDVVIASRHLLPNSIPDWTPTRRLLSKIGHVMTKTFLRMPYDATGGLRLYRLTRIPKEVFRLVRSGGYSFLFESAYVLHLNGFQIKQIPVKLPPRAEGRSKMNFHEVGRSIKALTLTLFTSIVAPERYALPAHLFKAASTENVERKIQAVG